VSWVRGCPGFALALRVEHMGFAFRVEHVGFRVKAMHVSEGAARLCLRPCLRLCLCACAYTCLCACAYACLCVRVPTLVSGQAQALPSLRPDIYIYIAAGHRVSRRGAQGQ